MSSALATPSSTMRAASFMASAWIRGTMKPGVAAHTTGTLPIPSSKPFTRAMMFGCAREIVDQDGRCRRSDDDVGADGIRGRTQHFAFQVNNLRHTFEDDARIR